VMAVECVLLETGVKAGRSLRVLTSGENVMVKVCLLKHSTQFNSGVLFNEYDFSKATDIKQICKNQ